MERYQLTYRDEIPDESINRYRATMAQIWFPNDNDAQKRYINLPGNPPFGNVTHSMCLVDSNNPESVVGTIALYDFAKIRQSNSLTNNQLLLSIPDWLTKYAYLGDVSIIPEAQGQGLAVNIMKQSLELANSNADNKNRPVFGITETKNISMKNVVKATGGRIANTSSCLFVKLDNSHRPILENQKSTIETVLFHLNPDFPPVIQMFYNKKGDLMAATIATSPNVPNSSNAKPTGDINQLYPNQGIGIINPNLETKQVKKLVRDIYASAGRFKYVSLYQMTGQIEDFKSKSPINNGFKNGWVMYKFNSN